MTVLNNMYGEGIENGWSPRGGQTLSVFGGGLNTGGSSSGSGVGLAAGFAAATIGCETMGSIVSVWSIQWRTPTPLSPRESS
jgi:amidase